MAIEAGLERHVTSSSSTSAKTRYASWLEALGRERPRSGRRGLEISRFDEDSFIGAKFT